MQERALLPGPAWVRVPAHPQVSSRWQTQPNLGLESAAWAGRGVVDWKSSFIQRTGNPQNSCNASGNASQPGRISVLSQGGDGCGVVVSPLPPGFCEGTWPPRSGEGEDEANVSSQGLWGGLTYICSLTLTGTLRSKRCCYFLFINNDAETWRHHCVSSKSSSSSESSG